MVIEFEISISPPNHTIPFELPAWGNKVIK